MRNRLRRAAVAAGTLGLLATLLAVPSATAAGPAAGPTGTPTGTPTGSPTADPAAVAPDACSGSSEESPVQVEVTTLLPRAPSRPDEPLQLAGRLRNCGREALEDLQLRLGTGPVIRTRGELQRADDEPVVGSARVDRPARTESLAPGESTDFDLRLLVGDLGLGSGAGNRLGVYPLSLQARARYGGDARRTAVGLATTFLPWFPDGPPAPTRIAWLWPLVDQPRRAPGEVMLDDVLDALLAPGDGETPRGRLQELLVAAREGSRGACDPTAAPPEGTPREPAGLCRGEPVPVTYGLDPALLYSVEAMVRPYTVLQGGTTVDRPASQNAEQWLVALRAAAVEADLLALPFGDPDVVAMSRTGRGLRDDVQALRRLGTAVVQDRIDSPRLVEVSWPPPGPVASALDLLVDGPDGAVVLDPSALPPAPFDRNRTPNARTELPSPFGPVTGLVLEEVLSALVEPDTADWQGPRLAEQRWIAETALIAADRPSESRTLVVAPRRQASVVPAVAAAILADTGRLPWLCPVRLAEAAAGTERCTGLPDAQPPAEAEPRVGREGDREPEPDRAAELAPDLLDELARVRAESDQFTEAVLVGGTDAAADAKARLLRARGRAASAAWRDQPAAGRRMLGLLEADVRQLRERVRLLSRPVILTGSSGTIELAVQNELDQAVNVGVRLDETSAARLSSTGTDVQVVPARNSSQILVRVEPRTSGRFVVQATLVDEEGVPFGEPVELDVRSTQYGRVAIAVTGVAFAVLLVAVGVRITRRAMRRQESA